MLLAQQLERIATNKKMFDNTPISEEESNRRRDKLISMMGNRIKVKK